MKQGTSQSGFTLIEVMLSLLILAIVTIGAAALLSQIGAFIGGTTHSRTAIGVANDLLETALSADYDSLLSSSTIIPKNGIVFSVNRVVNEYSTPIGHKDVFVSVSYNGVTNSARTYAIDGFAIQN